MPTVLITGANRGLGLEYARQFAEQGSTVYACARNPDAESLRALDSERVKILKLDVTDHDVIDAVAAQLDGVAIDVLINNAGSSGPQGVPGFFEYSSIDNIDYDIWRQMQEVNVIGAFKIATAFREHLNRAERGLLVNVSSFAGSLAQTVAGGQYPYRVSKASLNIITRALAQDCPGFITVSMVPGWCRTNMGGDDAPLATEDSVKDQLDTLARLTQEDSGTFIDRFGRPMPW